MENLLSKSRLLQNAVGGATQMPEDYSVQFEEFITLAHDVLYGDKGYLAIDEELDDALAIIEQGLKRKKKCNVC